MKKGKLIVLVGPTAVGKTSMAIRLAEHFRTEVVSADSRQVFREMAIGTAKPSKEELARVRHHLIDCRAVAEEYDASTYAEEAQSVLDGLFGIHEYVILCGGSGLYIKALLEGFDELPDVPADVRKGVIAEHVQKGLAWLQEEVKRVDPDYFEIVDRQNPQRLMRALEVFRQTGKPFSGFHKKTAKVLPFDVIKIGLTLDREILYQRIDQRVDAMIDGGLMDEAEKLFAHRHLPALQTVGYQELFGFMEGNYDRDEAIRLLKRNTRHYAKRQLTWFGKDATIQWFSPDDWSGILAACETKSVAR